ncbi:MAG: hypothetical protein L0G93_07205 [Acinetobacter sp.]|nr:hypothetical protein [Acinetobacter sp.]MDN5648100.1 hypothetical protein [Acinetobacter sp.]
MGKENALVIHKDKEILFRFATGYNSCIATDMIGLDGHHIRYMGNSTKHVKRSLVLQ